jgi:DNA recombination protein RmuC
MADSSLVLIAFGCLVIGFLLGVVSRNKTVNRIEKERAALAITIEVEQKNKQQFDDLLDQTRDQLANTFHHLSEQALSQNNTQFLRLAEENLKRFQSEAKAELSSKEQAIEQLLKPINEALRQTHQQIHDIEKERQQTYGSLKETIAQMATSQQQLQHETQNLVQALRRPEVRGQWGELTLRRLAELSGMVAHCDFIEQTHTVTETGAIRPDMVVRLPEKRDIIVDAKTPLDAYLSAIQTTDDVTRKAELKRHALIIRQRVKELARKQYWAEFTQSPEFVVLFIPGEQFLSSALEQDPALLEDSMSQQVILATPSSLVALLRAVAYGWKQQVLADNAEQIRELGETLYKRLAVFGGHLNKLGSSLDSSITHFNSAVGSLERTVLPSARKFTDMGISNKHDIQSLSPIDQSPRHSDAIEENE